MTVKHLQSIQRQQLASAVTTDPNVIHKFKNGFSECATEVNRYISNMNDVDSGVKQRLVAHLSGCVNGLQQVAPAFSFPGIQNTASTTTIPLTISQNSNGVSIQTGFNGDVNNNQNSTRIQVPAGIQLIPSRLPTGELALLVPNSSNLPFFSPTMLSGYPTTSSEATSSMPSRSSNSAFTSVRPSRSVDSLKMKMSPPLSPASSTTSYEDHQVSDSFSKPRTPSPREVSIPYPTPPGPSHSSAFKPSSIYQDQSPPQVTSTSISPENKNLKIEYKTVPIYQPNDKRDITYRPQKALEPLSVITSDRFKTTPTKETVTSDESYYKRSLKRSYPVETEGLLTVANEMEQPSSSKYIRYSDDVSTTTTNNSNGNSPDQRLQIDYYHKPSTSGHVEQHSDNNDSMWRPW